MSIKLSHTRLLVNDFQASLEFYKSLLNVEPIVLTPTYADLPAGNGNIALYVRSEMSKAIQSQDLPDCDRSQQDSHMLIFTVADVDRTFDELKGQHNVIQPPVDRVEWGVRTCHFRDPDGNLIEINQDL
ncbi:MAG: VOC family protein [Aestuariibacter sp.]